MLTRRMHRWGLVGRWLGIPSEMLRPHASYLSFILDFATVYQSFTYHVLHPCFACLDLKWRKSYRCSTSYLHVLYSACNHLSAYSSIISIYISQRTLKTKFDQIPKITIWADNRHPDAIQTCRAWYRIYIQIWLAMSLRHSLVFHEDLISYGILTTYTSTIHVYAVIQKLKDSKLKV